MYPPPEGTLETPDQIRELDDTFLTSDPFGYFVARIGMLHAWARFSGGGPGDESENDATEPQPAQGDHLGGAPDVAEDIGRPDLFPIMRAVMRNEGGVAQPEAMTVSAQVAVDAFALRHHVAEALVRLLVGAAERSLISGMPSTSLWSRLTDDKNVQISQLLDAVRKAADDLGEFGFARLIVPPSVTIENAADQSYLGGFADLCAEWVERAVELLGPSELDINTAHNKVKHGLAVRGRADLKVPFTTVGPDADGNVPVSAFDGDTSFNIFERPVLEFMSRAKTPGTRRGGGLEVTQLQLDYRHLLAESMMMSYVHGALFHVAACQHFKGREVPRGLSVAPHPGLAGQDAARPNLAGHQVGLKFPITKPTGGGEARPAGFWHRDGASIEFSHVGKRVSAQVIDPVEPGDGR
ncbi:hypothetical protein [Aeromicrobium chenweiae]|uniref:Uncharacterized protein n=1 Tax=Aeromicrobium chenweiae TaxID=2079793 RepID=A0A2S0WII4_9ACTN|nr:hypothetical protein [Aeromicrobium chenweiae]AWB91149.1 hypothetical protein C3E78_02325 [Aeromicrobium chenweiae]TGN31669.1 hypothetical protein E4L97_11840 [Aeromicrobium chenweiae]